MPRVLGIDPGVATMGWCIVQLHGTGTPIVLAVGVIGDPMPAADKDELRLVCQRQLRRLEGIATSLRHLLRNHAPEVVVAEGPGGTQSSSQAWTYGAAMGLIASLQLPTRLVTPQAIKRYVGGNAKASKEQVHDGVKLALHADVSTIRPALVQHAVDALASVIVAYQLLGGGREF